MDEVYKHSNVVVCLSSLIMKVRYYLAIVVLQGSS